MIIFPESYKRIGKCLAVISSVSKQPRIYRGVVVRFKGLKWLAPRLSFHLNVKPIKRLAGKNVSSGIICHTCDNPWCIEPKHLYYGNKSSNMNDVYERSPDIRETLINGHKRSWREGKYKNRKGWMLWDRMTPSERKTFIKKRSKRYRILYPSGSPGRVRQGLKMKKYWAERRAQ